MIYEEIRALNWSTLRQMAHSPRLCRHRMEHPEPDGAALLVGRALHCRVLEPASYAARYAVCDVRRDARTHVYQDWLADHEGVEALTAAEGAQVDAMAAAVAEHQVARDLLRGGRAEESVQWTDQDTGIACKGRLDYILPHVLVDLKTVDASRFHPLAFGGAYGEAARRRYHAQLAWYHDGCVAAGLLSPTTSLPWLVAVEKAPRGEAGYCHDVACYQLELESYEAGRELWRGLLRRYAECQAAGWWPGVAPQALELYIPSDGRGWNTNAGDPFAEEDSHERADE